MRLLLLVALLWAVLAGAQLALSYFHVRAGEAAASEVRNSVNARALRSGELREGVEEASDRFGRAHRLLSGPVLAPLRVLPVAGRQIRAVSSMADVAAEAAAAGIDPLAEAGRFLADEPEDDAGRLRAVQKLAASLSAADAELGELEPGPGDALFGPVADRRERLTADLEELRRTIGDAAVISHGMANLLDGPRRYLLFAANNAEMRAGSGMLLSVGEVTFSDGAMEIGEVDPTAELVLDADTAPPITGDIAARWGWLEPNRDFRNLAVTPRFDASSELALQMWEARTGDRLDGVIAVDAVALAAVLEATGSVSIDDMVIEPDEAVDFVLHDQYDLFGTVGPDQQARRDSLGRVATLAFERVADGEASLATLMEGLADAAGGRHILAWARRPAEQAAWTAAGVSGVLTEDAFGVMLLNRGGNKLDYFMTVACEAESSIAGGTRELTVRVTLRNRVDADEGRYVAGPHPALDAEPGEYVGLLAVTLPSDARRSRFEGVTSLAVSGPDGPTRVIATEVRVGRGETIEVVARTELPAARQHVQLEPSARVPPVRWVYDRKQFTDARGRAIHFR